MSPRDFPRFDLTVKLYKLTYLLGRIAEQTLADQADLTFAQYRLLMVLRHRRSISQKHLATAHGLTEAAVSRTVDGLVKRKFIVRQTNPTNRREHILLLTPAGERQAIKTHAILTKRLEKLYGVLSASDREKLQATLSTLLGSIWEEGKRVMCGPRQRQ